MESAIHKKNCLLSVSKPKINYGTAEELEGIANYTIQTHAQKLVAELSYALVSIVQFLKLLQTDYIPCVMLTQQNVYDALLRKIRVSAEQYAVELR